LTSCDWAKPACTIVSDGSRVIYEHELAHCAGWDHPALKWVYPPRRYVHPFAGRLTVIQCHRGRLAQADAVFVKDCRAPLDICSGLWADAGVDVAYYATLPGWQNVLGCSIRGL
jgi:hypothetical protein